MRTEHKTWIAMIAAACILQCLLYSAYDLPVALAHVPCETSPTSTQLPCGQAVFVIVTSFWGLCPDHQEVQRLVSTNPRGETSFLKLRNALVGKGFQVDAIKTEASYFASTGTPCIAHVGKNHFVNVFPNHSNYIVVIDGGSPPCVISAAQFEQAYQWEGYLLVVSK